MTKVAAVMFALAAAGCSHHIYSPPATALALGQVDALPHGEQALDVEVSTHSQIFDPPLNAGAGRYRRGIGDNAEVSVEGTAMVVSTGAAPGTNHSIYATHAGVSINPGEGPLSVFAGGGGGYAPAGGFFTSVDSGLSLGFENCYVVPVVTASAFVSQPLDAREVDLGMEDNVSYSDTPSTTVGSTVRGGLRVALQPGKCKRGEQSPWIYAGMGATTVMDHDSHDALMGAGLGVQVPL